MWVKFDSIEFQKGLTAKSGRKYDAWVFKGMKKGFNDEPDTPYEKTFFDNTTTSVIEKGVTRPGIGIVSFLRNGCEPGDTLAIQFTKSGPRRNLDVETIRNITKDRTVGGAQEYTPLPDTDADDIQYVKNNQYVTGSETPPWVR